MARPGGEVLFVGTERGLEARVVPAAGYPLELLDGQRAQADGPGRRRLRGLGRLPLALGPVAGDPARVPARRGAGGGRLRLGADGAGGGAGRLPDGHPGAEQRPRLHQPGAGPLVRAVFIAFEAASAAFPRARSSTTGNPVRRAFLEAAARVTASTPAGARTGRDGGCWWWAAARGRARSTTWCWRRPACGPASGGAAADRAPDRHRRRRAGDGRLRRAGLPAGSRRGAPLHRRHGGRLRATPTWWSPGPAR